MKLKFTPKESEATTNQIRITSEEGHELTVTEQLGEEEGVAEVSITLNDEETDLLTCELEHLQQLVQNWSHETYGGFESKSVDCTVTEEQEDDKATKEVAYPLVLGSLVPLLRIGAEVGLLQHATQSFHQGIHGLSQSEYEEARNGTLTVLLIQLMDYCSREGVSAKGLLADAVNTVTRKDWKPDRISGTMELEEGVTCSACQGTFQTCSDNGERIGASGLCLKCHEVFRSPQHKEESEK